MERLRTLIPIACFVLCHVFDCAPAQAQSNGFTFIKIADASALAGLSEAGCFGVNALGTVVFTAGSDAIWTGNGATLVQVAGPSAGGTPLVRPCPGLNDADDVAYGFVNAAVGYVTLVKTSPAGDIQLAWSDVPPFLSESADLSIHSLSNLGSTFMKALDGRLIAVPSGAPVHSGAGLSSVVPGTMNNNDVVAFSALRQVSPGVQKRGIYRGLTGPLLEDGHPVVSSILTAPPVINDSGAVAFIGRLSDGRPHLLTTEDGIAFADHSGSIDSSVLPYFSMNNSGTVVFSAGTADAAGLFTGPDPIADRIIGPGDPLDGSTVVSTSLSLESINAEGQIAFGALLADGRRGIYRADPIDMPQASNGTLAVSANSPTSGTLFATDPGGSPLTYEIVANATKGAVTITDPATGAYTYVPFTNATGADSFSFRVNNGTRNSVLAIVSVTIGPLPVPPTNRAPVAGSAGSATSSVRFDGSADELHRTADLPPITSFTMMGWFRAVSDNHSYSAFLSLGHPTSSNSYVVMMCCGNGWRQLMVWNGAGLKFGSNLTLGAWYHVAVTVAGTGSGQVKAYLNGVLDITFDGNPAVTANRLSIGNDSHGEWLDGNVAAVKVYDAVLTQAEIAQEMAQFPPARTTGLNSWYPLASAADAPFDYGVGGRTLGVGGVLTTESTAPSIPSIAVLTVDEDGVVSGTLDGSDPDGDAIRFAVVSNGAMGTVSITNATTGAFTYRPRSNANGSDRFSFTVTDGLLDSNTATVNVSIRSVNDAPVAAPGAASVAAGASVNGFLAATDVDGPSVAFSIVSNGAKGTATIDNATTGAYTYTANAGAAGTDTFTFKASDGASDSNAATVTVSIAAPAVLAPVAAAGTLNVTPGVPASGSLVASDPSSLPLTYSIVSNGSKGVVTITNASTGTFTYTPAAGATGSDSFTFIADNGSQTSNIATVTVVFAAPQSTNLPPVALIGTPVTTSVRFDGSADELYRTTNLPAITGFTMMGWFRVLSDSHSYSNFLGLGHATSSNSYLAMMCCGNGWRQLMVWNGNGMAFGSTLALDTWYHIALTVAGPGPGQLKAYLNGVLDITFDGNPAIIADRLSIGNDSHVEWLDGTAAAIKVFDAVLTPAEIAQEMAQTAPVRTAGLNSWYPLTSAGDAPLDASGAGRPLTLGGTLTTAIAAPPIVAPTVFTTVQNASVAGTLQGSDPDGDPLTFAIVTNGIRGVATITDPATGAFTYTPLPDAVGSDSFTFRVSDGVAMSNIAMVTVAIAGTAPVNHSPVAVASAAPVTALRINAVEDRMERRTNLPPSDSFTMMGWFKVASDQNVYSTFLGLGHASTSNSYVVQMCCGSGWHQLSIWNGAGIAFGPNLAVGTWYHIAMTVSGTGSGAFKAYLNGALALTMDGNPAVTADVLSIGNNPHLEWLDGSAAAVKVYAGVLTESEIAEEMTQPSPVRTTGLYAWYPLAASADAAMDFSGNGHHLTIGGTLETDNAGPPLSAGALATNEDTPLNGAVQAIDVDGNPLTYSIVSNGTLGTAAIVNAATGEFVYTPHPNATGTDTFTFIANDGLADSNVADVVVSVRPVNDAPVALGASVTSPAGGSISGLLSASDADTATLTYSIVANGAKGVVTITNPATGAFTYTANLGASGADAFSFIASDGTLSSNAATVSITIAANQPPVAISAGTVTTSVRFDGSADELYRTTNLPPITGFTMMGWFRVLSDGHSYSNFLGLGHATSSNSYLAMMCCGNGWRQLMVWNGAGLAFGSTLALDTWYHVALTVAGPGPGQLKAYLNGVLDITFDGNPAITADRLSIGNDSHVEWLDGTAAAIKVFDAVLTPAEIAQEMAQTAPVRTAGLNSWYPLTSAGDAPLDASGAGRPLTLGGTLTTAIAAPPIVAPTVFTTVQNASVAGTLQGSDPDGDPLTFAIVTNGIRGVATITDPATGAFTYTPLPGETGADTFTFKVNDGFQDSAVASIAVTITPASPPNP